MMLDIKELLQDSGKTNADYFIPEPNTDQLPFPSINNDDIDENARAFYDAHISLLNSGQQAIFDMLAPLIDANAGGLFHIDAPAGTGKTFLTNVLLAYVRRQNEVAIATAMSGIAANLLTKGTTAHHCFGFPIDCYDDSSCSIKLNSLQAHRIAQAKIIFIDECSMMHYRLLDCLHRFLQQLMDYPALMGGKLIVLLGDFRQILPVVTHGSKADILSASLPKSTLWTNVRTLHLHENMRVTKLLPNNASEERRQELEQYADWLLQVGEGTAPAILPNHNIIQIPPAMVCATQTEVMDQVYNDFRHNYSNPDYLSRRAIMACTNKTIREGNYEMLQKIPGPMFTLYSTDICVEQADQLHYDEDFLHRLNPSGIPPHYLPLKVNSVIILIRNLNVSKGHCNGTRYIVQSISNHLIKAKRLSRGPYPIIVIPPIPMISKQRDFPAVFKRTQFPILPAHFLTFNRAQGQSLERSGLELPESVFSHGQLYVGLSRNGDPNRVFVHANQDEFINLRQELPQQQTFTRNTVYNDIFHYLTP